MGLACVMVLGDVHVLYGPIFVCHVTQVICPADPKVKFAEAAAMYSLQKASAVFFVGGRRMLVAAAGIQAHLLQQTPLDRPGTFGEAPAQEAAAAGRLPPHGGGFSAGPSPLPWRERAARSRHGVSPRLCGPPDEQVQHQTPLFAELGANNGGNLNC